MKVKWHCPKCNYEWIKRICDRTYFKYGCKECSKNKRIKQGINDLYTWCQNNGEYGKRLLSEWMGLDENNNSVEIHNIAKGSSKEVKWQCQRCNNIWIAPVFRRTSGICGCKICSAALKSNVVNQNQVTIEDNTLYAWCLQNGEYGRQLLSEWTGLDENDKPVDIHFISRGARKKMKWRCKKGHEWSSTIKSRTTQKAGCRLCSYAGTSYPEQFIYWSLKQIFPNTENRCRVLKSSEYPQGIEFDIGVPSIPLCIEYSPLKTHTDKEDIDSYKKEICKQYNVRFIYVVGDHTQSNLFEANGDYIKFSTKTHQDEMLTKVVDYILKSLGHSINEININLSKDNALVYSRDKIEYEKSIAYLYPELAKEWDYEENGRLQPSDVTKGSSLKVHWKCTKCNHRWEAQVVRRTAKGYETGCPKCRYHWSDQKIHTHSRSRVIQGVNDLASQYPELAKEWHPTLNEIRPTEVKSRAHKIVYWQCTKCGYGSDGEWQANINRRTAKGYETGCQKCRYNWSKHM